MKVLFLYSGEIREPSWNVKWLEKSKEALPEIDFICTTWDRGIKYDFIDHYFEEPRWHYYPKNTKDHIKTRLNRIRDYKRKFDWPPTQEELLANPDIAEAMACWNKPFYKRNYPEGVGFYGRDRWKYRHHQLVGHAYAMKEFSERYDVVVRCRYDMNFTEIIDEVKDNLKLCYETGRRIEYLPIDESEESREEIIDQEPNKYLGVSNDWMIIHRTESFDYEDAIQKFKNKELLGAEAGWSNMFYGDTKRVWTPKPRRNNNGD